MEVFGDWEGWEVALSESEFEVSGAIEEFVIEVLVETSTTPSKKKRKVVAKSPLQKKKTKGTPEKFSVATPWIAGLAKGYILGSLLRVVDGKPKSIGGIPIRAGSSPSPGPVATVQTTPGKPSKAKKLTWEALYGLHKLPSASLQLSELEKGEYVLVVAEDGSTHRNIARDNLWIGRVEYTSTKHGKAYVHLRWFCQSRKTLLAEFADEREVCLLKECADVGIENVLRKVEVVKVGKEFTNGGEFGGAGKFYYRLVKLELYRDNMGYILTPPSGFFTTSPMPPSKTPPPSRRTPPRPVPPSASTAPSPPRPTAPPSLSTTPPRRR